MSSNITNASSGVKPVTDRTQPFVQTTKTGSGIQDAPRSDSATVQQLINNTQDLKDMELQGEHITISEAQLIKAIERALKALQGKTTSLEYSIHEKTKQIMVKVRDTETGEVIREIPPEKNLDFLAKIWETAGIFVDERR